LHDGVGNDAENSDERQNDGACGKQKKKNRPESLRRGLLPANVAHSGDANHSLLLEIGGTPIVLKKSALTIFLLIVKPS
jgi:hypothetical protein